MATHTALDAQRDSATILGGIHRADDLTVAAARDGGVRAVRLLAQAATDPSDQLTAIAAVHALAQVFDDSADEVLVALLHHDSAFLREHAAWALGTRLPRHDAIAGLVTLVREGGFTGMLAQRTLQQWGSSAADPVGLFLEGSLLGISEADARARLVETIGLIPGRVPERLLRRVATDRAENLHARVAAIAALGDRAPSTAVIALLSVLSQADAVGPSDSAGDVSSDDTRELAAVARLALFDLTATTAPRAPWQQGPQQGTTIAQLFLHADIDGELSQVGAGDNGGIATLLVRLGDALVAGPAGQAGINRVVTISRGTHECALDALADLGSTLPGHSFAAVPFVGGSVPSIDAWPRRVAAQRGIRRILRSAGVVDAIHLRMADVGSLATATVARDLDIPVVFTVAPDPHGVIDSLESSGALTRANFGTVDAVEHFWFRARLVQRLAADAAHTVLFPRPQLQQDIERLIGIDIDAHPERHSVIPEGIDLAVIERSRTDALASLGLTGGSLLVPTGAHARAATEPAALAFDQLDALLGTLPPERRGLPLLISVGRLHRVKGMAALVEAWNNNTTLRARCNLLIVGGDLKHPSGDEGRELQRIAGALAGGNLGDAAAQGLLLAGHRANDTVARWLAAAHYGRPGLAAPFGVYVCASMKEEFGIALLEAMASGLTVVAPNGGGPATYVEHGVTGFLVDTGDGAALTRSIADALALAAGVRGGANAARARSMVADKFTIEAMATTLAEVYRDVAVAIDPVAWELSVS
ncbi:glycosyltransferase involved in cell wall biosynthesis [Cryobacterium sp. CAN_C3]|uniref:glycosyltransferase n=1 Tax=unclassified Cryobacterium TaxID=2649013 RepID=UPI0018CAEB92|nr:glycosyltransferase [Cryobacterium sp. CAN_C3]MEC5154406.1 glycosyltransferase involved in cell wall biosynthesis [Cryobacterium sp. CAN_C3]